MALEPHGHTEHIWKGNILYSYPQDIFNKEGLEVDLKDLKDKIKKKANRGKWFRLIILAEDSLVCTDALEMLRDSYIWCFDIGCEAIAVVSNHSIYSSLLKFDEINIRYFGNEREAEEWLQSIGAFE